MPPFNPDSAPNTAAAPEKRVFIAGVDSSTQSCKVVIRDAETGALQRFGSAKHPDGTEVHPDAWWEAFTQASSAAGGLDDVEALAASDTVSTILPACDLSTRVQFAPARQLLDAGATVAIASNCNPGTSYTSSMNFCVGTAVLQQYLTLEEALRAATVGGARALRRGDVGSLTVGSRADLHVLDAPAAIHLAYRPGMPLTHAVFRGGRSLDTPRESAG